MVAVMVCVVFGYRVATVATIPGAVQELIKQATLMTNNNVMVRAWGIAAAMVKPRSRIRHGA